MSKMQTIKILIAAVAVVGLAGASSAAIYQEVFDAANGWDTRISPEGGDGTGEGTASIVGGTLQVSADTDALPPTTDFISVNGSDSVLSVGGNYKTLGVQGIYFDFYVDPANQASGNDFSLGALYFVGGGNYWFWTFSETGYESTGSRRVFSDLDSTTLSNQFGEDWYSSNGGSIATWANDLDNITEIGVVVGYAEGLTQIVSLDNFTLSAQAFYVPEPETYAAIMAAMLGMAFVFRKRLREVFAALPAFGQAAA
jgi:hypothetical protein